MPRILVADDDPEILDAISAILVPEGWQISRAGDGSEAVLAAEADPPDVALLDLEMPSKSGQEVLEELRHLQPNLPVVILTGQGTIQRAVDAMRAGAFNFLTKPPNADHLLLTLRRALERSRLQSKVERKQALEDARSRIIGGEAPAMKRFLTDLERVAASSSPVLLTGETGTGKELAARAIWKGGTRRDRPYTALNCATLSETLLESDLFGHEKGAFTGASSTKRGQLDEVDGGTLFLDEVGELPLVVQAKLLRVTETGEYQRVGSTELRKTDVRIIAATNRDLQQEITEGRFREDFFHRLSVITLEVPPLRDRKEDLEQITLFHLERLCAELGQPVPELTDEVWKRIRAYEWPGNVRELRNTLERALVLSGDRGIGPQDIPVSTPPDLAGGRAGQDAGWEPGTPLTEAVESFKRWLVARTLDACDGNQTTAAEQLGMHRSSLNRLMKELGLR